MIHASIESEPSHGGSGWPVVALLVAVLACSLLVWVPPHASAQQAEKNVPADAAAAAAHDTTSDYVIGPGDTIQVFI